MTKLLKIYHRGGETGRPNAIESELLKLHEDRRHPGVGAVKTLYPDRNEVETKNPLALRARG